MSMNIKNYIHQYVINLMLMLVYQSTYNYFKCLTISIALAFSSEYLQYKVPQRYREVDEVGKINAMRVTDEDLWVQNLLFGKKHNGY